MKLSILNTKRQMTEAEETQHWGFHLMLDISGCNDNIKDGEKLTQFIKDLVEAIKMKAVGEPVIKKFGRDGLFGYSVVQLIETSSITFHLIEETMTAYLDVFSCKDFDQEIVIAMVKERFGTKRIKKRFVYRDA